MKPLKDEWIVLLSQCYEKLPEGIWVCFSYLKKGHSNFFSNAL